MRWVWWFWLWFSCIWSKVIMSKLVNINRFLYEQCLQEVCQNGSQFRDICRAPAQRGILSWLSDIVAMILSFIPACLCIRFLHFLVVPWWRLENSSQNIGVSSWDLYWNSKDIIATMVIECFCSKYTVESCHQVTSIMKLYFLLNT